MKETIFKAQVYNDSEKSRVKQHKIFQDYLSVTANLKFAVSFLSACYNACFNFTCYHPPPGNPGDKSNPSVPGVGNCLKPSCPGGRGVGQIENNFMLFS